MQSINPLGEVFFTSFRHFDHARSLFMVMHRFYNRKAGDNRGRGCRKRGGLAGLAVM